jgi:small subunit ribosomal protein S13
LSASEYRYIVRIAGKDVDGSRKVAVAVSEIKGIGFNFASAMLESIGLDPAMRVGFLSDAQISQIEGGIKDPLKAGLPAWYLNRRRDLESGTDAQVIGSDWDIATRNDIEREKQIGSWRGFRHMFGLKVRGQRTRTTGRKGGAVGVKKPGRIIPTAAPGAPGAPGAPAEEAAAPAGKEAKPGAKPEAKAAAKPEAKPAAKPAAAQPAEKK